MKCFLFIIFLFWQLPIFSQSVTERGNGALFFQEYNLNKAFSKLTKKTKYQYQHNPSINHMTVTGVINIPESNSTAIIEDLAFQYGAEVYIEGDKLFVLTAEDLAPRKKIELRLRNLTFEQIREFISQNENLIIKRGRDINLDKSSALLSILGEPEGVDLFVEKIIEADE